MRDSREGAPCAVGLPLAETRALRAWCLSVEPSAYGASFPACARAVRRRLGELPALFGASLRRFGATAEAGGLLLSGVPVPIGLPPTPSRPYIELRHSLGTEPLLLAVMMTLGEIISFADWHGGDRVQNFYPLREQADRQNANNAVYLELHTETAFRPDTPDVLALLCLRADPAVATLLCDVAPLWRQLDARTRARLADPAFSFILADGRKTTAKPVVTTWRNRVRFNFAEALAAIDAEHARALEALKDGIQERTVRLWLAAGDLLVLDNTRVIHGRSAIGARYDGTDRWLQRCLGRRTGVLGSPASAIAEMAALR